MLKNYPFKNNNNSCIRAWWNIFFHTWTLLELRFLDHNLELLTVDLELLLFWNSRRCQMWIKVNPIHWSGDHFVCPNSKRKLRRRTINNINSPFSCISGINQSRTAHEQSHLYSFTRTITNQVIIISSRIQP